MHIRFMALAAILTTSVAFGAFIKEKPTSPSSVPSSSSTPAKISDSMIRLYKDNLTGTHAAAYVKWPKGAFLSLDAGECSMIVQTNLDERTKSDVFNLLTVPQIIVNNIPNEMSSSIMQRDHIVPSFSGDESLCKNMLICMIGTINRRLIMEGSNRGFVTSQIQQRITAFAIALAYKGKTYHAQAQWDEESDTLVPYLSPEQVQKKDQAVVDLRIDDTGIPIVPVLYHIKGSPKK